MQLLTGFEKFFKVSRAVTLYLLTVRVHCTGRQRNTCRIFIFMNSTNRTTHRGVAILLPFTDKKVKKIFNSKRHNAERVTTKSVDPLCEQLMDYDSGKWTDLASFPRLFLNTLTKERKYASTTTVDCYVKFLHN